MEVEALWVTAQRNTWIYLQSPWTTDTEIRQLCSSRVTWCQITHSLFQPVSEKANPDRDLWMHLTEGNVLTSVHQSLFTCFIRQACVKTNFDISLDWNMPGSLAALFCFCSINTRDDSEHFFLWLLTVSIRMFTVLCKQTDSCIPGASFAH